MKLPTQSTYLAVGWANAQVGWTVRCRRCGLNGEANVADDRIKELAGWSQVHSRLRHAGQKVIGAEEVEGGRATSRCGRQHLPAPAGLARPPP
jgi:hypothetical protein